MRSPRSSDRTVLGVEDPFPWLLIVVWAAVAAPILLGLFAVIVGGHYLPWWH